MFLPFGWTRVLLEFQLDRKTGRASFKLKILFFLIKISLLNVKLCRYKDQNSCSAALKTSLTKALSFIFCEFVNFSFERVPNPRKGNDDGRDTFVEGFRRTLPYLGSWAGNKLTKRLRKIRCANSILHLDHACVKPLLSLTSLSLCKTHTQVVLWDEQLDREGKDAKLKYFLNTKIGCSFVRGNILDLFDYLFGRYSCSSPFS